MFTHLFEGNHYKETTEKEQKDISPTGPGGCALAIKKANEELGINPETYWQK